MHPSFITGKTESFISVYLCNHYEKRKPSLICGAKFRVVSCHSIVSNVILRNVTLRYIPLDFLCAYLYRRKFGEWTGMAIKGAENESVNTTQL